VVITALAYLAWNRGRERVTAPRAAIVLNVQPVVGGSLGVLVMGDAASPFTPDGGVLVLGGLYATVRPGPA
jgi:drug/metabolite transporter (DMT)-like permease